MTRRLRPGKLPLEGQDGTGVSALPWDLLRLYFVLKFFDSVSNSSPEQDYLGI